MFHLSRVSLTETLPPPPGSRESGTHRTGIPSCSVILTPTSCSSSALGLRPRLFFTTGVSPSAPAWLPSVLAGVPGAAAGVPSTELPSRVDPSDLAGRPGLRPGFRPGLRLVNFFGDAPPASESAPPSSGFSAFGVRFLLLKNKSKCEIPLSFSYYINKLE